MHRGFLSSECSLPESSRLREHQPKFCFISFIFSSNIFTWHTIERKQYTIKSRTPLSPRPPFLLLDSVLASPVVTCPGTQVVSLKNACCCFRLQKTYPWLRPVKVHLSHSPDLLKSSNPASFFYSHSIIFCMLVYLPCDPKVAAAT